MEAPAANHGLGFCTARGVHPALHVAAAGNSLIADLMASGRSHIDLVRVLKRLALEIKVPRCSPSR